MSMKLLGKTIDVHTGGEDNKFPHHECEIAQSEGVTGKQFVRYWLHVKHLLVDGQKMSKSLGNFYTLRDLLERGFSPRAIRYVLLSTHYRDTLNFTFDSLRAAEAALERLDELATRLSLRGAQATKQSHSSTGLPRSAAEAASLAMTENVRHLVQKTSENFIRAMDDDLNISKGLAVVFGFVKKVNVILDSPSPQSSPQGGEEDLLSPPSPFRGEGRVRGGETGGFKEALKLLKEFDKVLGLGIGKVFKVVIPAAIQRLAAERESAREQKKWDRADAIRKELEQKGFIVEDSPTGPRVKKARL